MRERIFLPVLFMPEHNEERNEKKCCHKESPRFPSAEASFPSRRMQRTAFIAASVLRLCKSRGTSSNAFWKILVLKKGKLRKKKDAAGDLTKKRGAVSYKKCEKGKNRG